MSRTLPLASRKALLFILGILLTGPSFSQSAKNNSLGSLELSGVLFSPTYSTQFRDSLGIFGGFYRISPSGGFRYRFGLEGGISSGLIDYGSSDYSYLLLQLSLHAGFEIHLLKGPYGAPFLLVEGIGSRTQLNFADELSGKDRFDLWTYGYRAGAGFQFGSKRRSLRIIGFIRGEPATLSGRKIDIGGLGGSLAFTF